MKRILLAIIAFGFLFSSCQKVELSIVKTLSAETINLDSVLLTGEVLTEKNGAVTKRGFFWGTNPNPTAGDNSSENLFGPGIYSQKIPINLGQQYYVRSYATTADGTQFGQDIAFKVEINPITGSFTDPRDGQQYSTVKIVSQTWMAENLAYLPEVSPSDVGSWHTAVYYVYGYYGTNANEARGTDNFKTYGALYNASAASSACPAGWHLPSIDEWTILLKYIGSKAPKLLKATTGWGSSNGDNASKFSALPGGGRFGFQGSFGDVGEGAYFWSASDKESAEARWTYIGKDGNFIDRVNMSNHETFNGVSVRCIQNK